MSETREPKKVGVALMGAPQSVYDIVWFQQLRPSEQEDTEIPYERRESIMDGVRAYVADKEKVDADTDQHDMDLHYLIRVHAELASQVDNVDADLFDGLEPFEYPLWDFLETPGVKAYTCPDNVYDLLGYGKTGHQRQTMIFVFDDPFEMDDDGEA